MDAEFREYLDRIAKQTELVGRAPVHCAGPASERDRAMRGGKWRRLEYRVKVAIRRWLAVVPVARS